MAGYGYWLYRDFRIDPENGNLPQRWAALPLLLSKPAFLPLDSKQWKSAAGTDRMFLYGVGNDPQRILGEGRMHYGGR